MKNFNEMTQSEINSLSEEDFKAISPFEKKSCYDCGYLKSAMNWWCTNKEARKARGTSIPGCIKCTFWKPDWNVIDDKYKTKENGYLKPIKHLPKMVIEKSNVKTNNTIIIIVFSCILVSSFLLYLYHNN